MTLLDILSRQRVIHLFQGVFFLRKDPVCQHFNVCVSSCQMQIRRTNSRKIVRPPVENV